MIKVNAQQMYNSQVVYRETLIAQQRANYVNGQYDLIRPFCPVCMKRHEAGLYPVPETPSPRGVFRCDLCTKKIYPIPVFLLDTEALDGLLSL